MQDMGIKVLLEGNNLQRLLVGLSVTLWISFLSIGISSVAGLLVGIIMTSKNRLIVWIFRIYLETIRIVPQLVLLFLFYFGLARGFNINISGELAAIIVFSLWGTAEMGDLVRGAITSLPKHQFDSGLALGLSKRSLYRYVIIPQVLRRLLPQAINLVTRMIKTSSLVILIGVVEVNKIGQQIIDFYRTSSPSVSLWIYGVIFCIYFMIFSQYLHFLAILNRFGRSEVVSQPVLELQNITKNFGQQTILNHLSLSVKEGEVVVILGPSGCGKSTLLRCINKLESIQEGDILLDGQSILSGTLSLQDIRQKIGMVFQDYELFPHMDVLQNLTLAPVKSLKRKKEEVQAEAESLLKRVGLVHKKHSYARELSGGQKQRVAIIRSLLMHPEILLFDEVTASLDPEMVREVLVLINDLAKEGRTMLIVTHEMEFARAIADRIIFMDKGEIIEENTVQNFFQHPQTQRAQAFLTTFDFNHF